MKKNLFNVFFLAAVCFCSLGIQKNLRSNSSSLSGLMLENVEALTYELPEVVITCGGEGTYGKCWKKSPYLGGFQTDVFLYICEFSGCQKHYCIPQS